MSSEGEENSVSADLERFVAAQAGVYPQVVAELSAGRKLTHWMWFVFPQVAGLGSSPMAEMYAIASLAEAEAYLAHPLLGARLRECAGLLLGIEGRTATEVMGVPDDLKLRSSATLFAAVERRGNGEPGGLSVFQGVLDKYFGGEPDPLTVATLERWERAAKPEGNTMWEDPNVVAAFAARPPDHRLQHLLAGEEEYGAVRAAWSEAGWRAGGVEPRVLDIGCAGGRNTVWLAQQGCDVWALDASFAMVEETRRRLAELLGREEATRRVRVGAMRSLAAHADGSFDLVVALGVLQDARSSEEWHAALAEVARVLRPGGLCLVANFGPDSRPSGEPLSPVPGETDVWVGFGPGERRMTLPSRGGLDADFARHGLHPALPTAAVTVPTAAGHRVTLNALYRR